MTLDDARTLDTGSGADQITMNGTGVQTVNVNGGNDTVILTATGAGSAITLGAGNDTADINGTSSFAVSGGEGNDGYDISADADVAITDESGTDDITFDAAGSIDLSNNSNFSFSGIETIDITATGGTTTMHAADLSGKTLTIVGDGATDIIKALGDGGTGGTAVAETIDLSAMTTSGTATIQIDAGDKADTVIGSATKATTFIINDGDVDAGEIITGGTATDILDGSGLTAAIDLSVATITLVDTLYTNAQNATLSQGTGITSIANDASTALNGEQFTLVKSTTSFEASAEGSAGAVNIAGEWFLTQDANGDLTNGDNSLTYYDEVLGEAVTVALTGVGATDVATGSIVAGSLVIDIA
jgi:hypothetical protein